MRAWPHPTVALCLTPLVYKMGTPSLECYEVQCMNMRSGPWWVHHRLAWVCPWGGVCVPRLVPRPKLPLCLVGFPFPLLPVLASCFKGQLQWHLLQEAFRLLLLDP